MSLPITLISTKNSSVSSNLSPSISANNIVLKQIEPNQDSINLSPEAQAHLQDVSDAVPVSTPPLSSQEKEALYEKNGFLTHDLNSKYQSYADNINNKNFTDEQKLSAYSEFKIGSILAYARYGGGGGTVAQEHQDAEFGYEIRNSGLFSSSTLLFALDVSHQNQSTKIACLQQGVAALDRLSSNLFFSILNGTNASLLTDPAAANVNHTPGFIASGKPINTKTAVQQAIPATLDQLKNSESTTKTPENSNAVSQEALLQAIALFQHSVSSFTPGL